MCDSANLSKSAETQPAVLNPTLYTTLRVACGPVHVVRPGERRRVSRAPDYSCGGRIREEVLARGEEYQVPCPFCNDRGQHLAVNHMFGELDRRDCHCHQHLVQCYHGCLREPRNISKLLALLKAAAQQRGPLPPLAVKSSPALAVPREPPRLPQNVVPLHWLDADHPAVSYLRERGFDPVEIAVRCGVCYCAASDAPAPKLWRPRLVIPVHAPTRLKDEHTGCTLAGWQARALVAGTKPKYLSMSGMAKSLLLYGLPEALAISGPVVLVEGVTDAWRVGPGAVALFGKTVSAAQVRLLEQHCAARDVVILLDRDARADALAIQQQIMAAHRSSGAGRRVVIADVPAGCKDPGEANRQAIWGSIAAALKSQPAELVPRLPYAVMGEGKRARFSAKGLQVLGDTVAVAYDRTPELADPQDGIAATVGVALVGTDDHPRYVARGAQAVLGSLAGKARVYANALAARQVELAADLSVSAEFQDLASAAILLGVDPKHCVDPAALYALVDETLPGAKAPQIVVPAAPSVQQALREAQQVQRLWHSGRVMRALEAAGLDAVYRNIELPAVEVAARMIANGVCVDVDRVATLPEPLKQQANKLLLPFVGADGRIHAEIDPRGARTGRFACRKPNLLGLARELRSLVIPTEGRLLLYSDFAQHELRVLADLSRDENLLDAFRATDVDVHSRTAAAIFRKDLATVTRAERQQGKATNFAIIFGMSAQGLSKKLEIGVPAAEQLLTNFDLAYPGVAEWRAQIEAQAYARGYVSTCWGRRRELPDLQSGDKAKAAAALRQAVNTVVQGSAADHFKMVLARLHEELPASSRLVLPVHDAVLLEVPAESATEAGERVREIMQRAVPDYTVAFAVDVKFGATWAACS